MSEHEAGFEAAEAETWAMQTAGVSEPSSPRKRLKATAANHVPPTDPPVIGSRVQATLEQAKGASLLSVAQQSMAPSPPPRLEVASDASLPDFMRGMRCGDLHLAFDVAALAEYEADHVTYDEIFRHTSSALARILHAVGQCPVWLHGLDGCWRYGHELKLRDGVDLGEASQGLAWYGNNHYPAADGGQLDQEESIFLINMPRAVRGHPNVLVHELTHAFHFRVGPERLPQLRDAYDRFKGAKAELLQRFTVHNVRQFEVTFTNEFEFFAYMMEAYHCAGASESVCGICFGAPAFPHTRAELCAVDCALGVGIIEAIESSMAIGLPLEAPETAGEAPAVLPDGGSHPNTAITHLSERFQPSDRPGQPSDRRLDSKDDETDTNVSRIIDASSPTCSWDAIRMYAADQAAEAAASRGPRRTESVQERYRRYVAWCASRGHTGVELVLATAVWREVGWLQYRVSLEPNIVPYHVDPGIEHWVLWYHPDDTPGDTDLDSSLFTAHVRVFLPSLQEEEECIAFQNLPQFRSVPQMAHAHVFLRSQTGATAAAVTALRAERRLRSPWAEAERLGSRGAEVGF